MTATTISRRTGLNWQRAVLHLTVVEGRTDRERSAQLGIHPASVRAHRRRARTKLGRMIGDEEV